MKRCLSVFLAALIAFAPLSVRAQTGMGDGKKYKTTGTQGMSVGGVDRSDSTFRVITVGADGRISNEEANPARLDFRDGSVPIIDATCAAASACSSNVVNMGSYRLQAIGVTMSGNVNASVRIAIQVRVHLNQQSDSSSVLPFMHRTPGPQVAIDTSLAYNSIAAPLVNGIGRSEFAINLTDDRLQAAVFGARPNAYVMLKDILGTEFWAPYISVRLRVVNTPTALASPATFRVYLFGAPQ